MEQNKTKKVNSWLIFVSVLFAAATITLGVLYGVSCKQKDDYSIALENVYEQSFYEVNSILQSLEVKVDKAVVSNDKAMQRQVLNEIWRDCNLAASSLASIPIDFNSQTETIRFLNQLGGYSVTLADKTLTSSISETEFDKLAELQKHCIKLKNAFNTAALMVSTDGFKIVENLKIVDGTSEFEAGFSELTNNQNTPPELIYDGPFSDSLSDKEIKGLPETTYTESDVKIELEKMFAGYDIESIVFDGYVEGDFASYNHTLNLKNGDKICTTVAKRGKFLLQLNRINAASKGLSDQVLTDDELMKVATDFVKNMQLENFEAIFISRGDGLAYVNVAPIITLNEAKIVVYPDIIKVKLDEETGDILGYEAKSYAFNHVARTLDAPTLSATEATAKISNRLTIISTRLALTPKDNGSEVLCYEFECSKDGIVFYVFINANTGAEEDIFRVIENSEGRNVI